MQPSVRGPADIAALKYHVHTRKDFWPEIIAYGEKQHLQLNPGKETAEL